MKMQRIIVKKVSMTLIELLLVISLLIIGGSFMAFNIKKAVDKEAFQTNLELFVSKIKLAQEISLNYNTDVELQLFQTEKGLQCTLLPLANLPPAFLKTMNGNSLLKEIKSFTFEKESYERFSLFFYANNLNSEGIIEFRGKNELESQSFFIPSYPSKIDKKRKKIHYEKALFPQDFSI